MFPANIDAINVVKNQLPTPIAALCLRIYPVAWDGWPDIKLEVFGRPSV